jgi:hypothetical protein
MTTARPSVAWIVLSTLVVFVAGCAHWGSKDKARADLSKTLDREMAVASEAKQPDAKASSATSPAPVVSAEQYAKDADTKLAQPAALAGGGAQNASGSTPEYQALVTETLARYKALPDTTPQKYDELARTLQQGEPVPMLFLRQFNATLVLQQEQLAEKKGAATASVAYPETALAHVVPSPVKPAAATEAAPEQLPSSPSPAPASPATEQAPSESPSAATDSAATASTASANVREPSLADRVLYAKRSAPQATASGIFGGKVQTSGAGKPAETSEPKIHTTQRPTGDVSAAECTDCEQDAGGQCAASAPPSLAASAKTSTPDLATDEATDATETIPWSTQLAETIRALEHDLQHGQPTPQEAARYQASLRILYLLADRKNDALRALPDADADEQEYWNAQLHGLHVLLADEGTPLKDRRAALALRSLREAVDHLSAAATLDLTNVVLCKQVSIWGTYEEFARYEFQPDQEVLLYMEVENFASESTSQGYATEFVSSYRVFDAAGRRLAEHEFPTASEVCRQRRHDYFIRYPMHIPRDLAPGEYTLQVTVEDQKAKKCGQRSVKFRVL